VLREAGYDRDEATVRDQKTLEGYWQRRRRRLNKLGFKAASLDGGFDAWKARYPVEPPEVERAEAR
jgi:rhodanese-related sulfurtransferase